MTGCSMDAAPGTARFKTDAMPPVIGSRSLNATRNGLFHADSWRQAARLACVAGSSGDVGTRPGIARTPAVKISSGNGASYAASTASDNVVWQPDCTSRETLSVGAVRTTSRNRSQTSGIGWAPGGSPVLAATTQANRSG